MYNICSIISIVLVDDRLVIRCLRDPDGSYLDEFDGLTTRLVRTFQNNREQLIAVGRDPVGYREPAEPLYRQVLYCVARDTGCKGSFSELQNPKVFQNKGLLKELH